MILNWTTGVYDQSQSYYGLVLAVTESGSFVVGVSTDFTSNLIEAKRVPFTFKAKHRDQTFVAKRSPWTFRAKPGK